MALTISTLRFGLPAAGIIGRAANSKGPVQLLSIADLKSAFGLIDNTTPVTNLGKTGVTPGSYTNANLTVGADGRITSCSNGTASGVTSVGLSLPGIFSVTGSPVTGSGTLTATLATQTANYVWAGPASGSAAAPTFRALVAADLPTSGVSAGSYTSANITVDAYGRVTAASNGSGGGGASVPTVRGSTQSTPGSVSSITLTLPSGSAAGDLAILFAGGGYNPIQPSGWTTINQDNGSNFEGGTYGKILTSGDISTGSVTVSFGSTYNACAALIVFEGSTTYGIYGNNAVQSGSGSTSVSLAATNAPIASSYGVYFGANRGNSTNTVNTGSQLQQSTDGSNCSACLYGGATSSGSTGNLYAFGASVFSFSSAGSGYYCSLVFLAPT